MCSFFCGICNKSVISTVEAFAAIYRRNEIEFDIYIANSLKAETRSTCGQGVRRRVTDKGKLLTSSTFWLTRLLKGVSEMLLS